jgi:hypothetical protein
MSKIIVDVSKIKVIYYSELSRAEQKKLDKRYDQYLMRMADNAKSLEDAIIKGKIFWQPRCVFTERGGTTYGFPMIPEDMLPAILPDAA